MNCPKCGASLVREVRWLAFLAAVVVVGLVWGALSGAVLGGGAAARLGTTPVLAIGLWLAWSVSRRLRKA